VGTVWHRLKTKFLVLKKLDEDTLYVRGSTLHKYQVHPVVSAEVIDTFENANRVELPLEYKSYLREFGSGGAFPSGNLDRFPDAVVLKNVGNPLLLKSFTGNKEFEELNQSLVNEDGLLCIGKGNHSSIYLVLNGEMAGKAMWWNYDYFAYCGGRVDEWFENWLDQSILQLQNMHLLDKAEPGMTRSELLSIIPMSCAINNKVIVRFKDIFGDVQFDDSDRVKRIIRDRSTL